MSAKIEIRKGKTKLVKLYFVLEQRHKDFNFVKNIQKILRQAQDDKSFNYNICQAEALEAFILKFNSFLC